LFFRPPRTDSVGPDHDPLLALAIREARDHGVPVVLATRDWWLEDGRPDISAPLLDAQALWGGVTVGEHGGHYWTSLVVAREGVEDMPALCLAAYAAFRSPTTFHEYAIEGQDVVVRHYDLAAGRPERVPRGDCRVRGVGVRVFSPTDASHGLVPGDLEAFHVFVLPGPDAWRRSTLRYELLWRADPYELRRALGDKVVVIADPEFDACVEGSDTKAARVHAAAVQSLILRNGTDWAGPWNVVLAGCA